MKTLHYPIPVSLRGDRLEAELRTALRTQAVSVSVGTDLIVTVPDNAADATVTATVTAHDGSPTAAEVAERAAHQADIDTLRAFLNAATPTAVQTVTAVKALIRVVRAQNS